jgi:formylglycine-generating enzyme required for sulfatase activity
MTRTFFCAVAALAVAAAADTRPVVSAFGVPEFDMVTIRPGSFLMGSDEGDADERPVHRVTITTGFEIGKYEVTQAQWQAIMGANPSEFKNCPGACPVERVSWLAAQDFVARLNRLRSQYTYRLPTEAEWEHAARAGRSTPFGIGDGKSLSAEEANFDGRYPFGNASKAKNRGVTLAVGSFAPNAWGVQDMHGNVWEWTADVYGPYAAGGASDPTGPARGEFHVRRGGGWTSRGEHLRSAYRSMNAPSDHHHCGLRLARVPRRVA